MHSIGVNNYKKALMKLTSISTCDQSQSRILLSPHPSSQKRSQKRDLHFPSLFFSFCSFVLSKIYKRAYVCFFEKKEKEKECVRKWVPLFWANSRGWEKQSKRDTKKQEKGILHVETMSSFIIMPTTLFLSCDDYSYFST